MTRRRYAAFTQGSDYKQTRGTMTPTDTWVSIQPLTQAERQELLEIHKVSGTHKGYIGKNDPQVRVIGDPPSSGQPLPADEIYDDEYGLLYRVVANDPHRGWGLQHQKIFLAREIDTP